MKDYEKLVQLLDKCAKDGSAHISVKAPHKTEVEKKHTGACEGGACCSPTLHKGIDDK